jgi:uncharacterized protein YuzE
VRTVVLGLVHGKRDLKRLWEEKGRSWKELNGTMAKVSVWYDKEADFLEVIFQRREGYFRETKFDDVMEKVDTKGKVIGFSIMNVSKGRKKTVDVELTADVA